MSYEKVRRPYGACRPKAIGEDFRTTHGIDARRSLSGFCFMAFADAAGANEDEIPVITMCRAGMQLRQAIMPTYNVDKIVDSTPFRKDGTEIISKNGKRMWRVILDIREFPGT